MTMHKHIYKMYKCFLGFDIILDSFDCDHTHEIQIVPCINMHLKHTMGFVFVLDIGVASKTNSQLCIWCPIMPKLAILAP
jgi:hypothetical protein